MPNPCEQLLFHDIMQLCSCWCCLNPSFHIRFDEMFVFENIFFMTATAYSHPKYETFITLSYVRNFNPITFWCVKKKFVACEDSSRFIYPMWYKYRKNSSILWYRMLTNTSTIKYIVRLHIFHNSMWETKWLFEIRHQINNQVVSFFELI